MSGDDIDRLCIDTMRTLAMDAVQKANSGHPGTPMALAPVAYTLWQQFLRYDPADPTWPNRDRFVLSVGHASMLLYALLHLAGVKRGGSALPSVSLDDIKRFRQLDGRCPGHPEYHFTDGVETTTGPLGQGCGNSVGLAIAAMQLATTYNRPGFDLFDYDTYVLCSDGDMMEGVASEAASLAGHLRLHNLCWIYDSNHISIDGSTSLTFSEDVGRRFEAYGWRVHHVDDANDTSAMASALRAFKAERERPTFIVVTSRIGFGAPNKEGKASAHGSPLGAEEVRLTKRAYGWPEDAQFLVPDGVYEHFQAGIGQRGAAARSSWGELFERYRAEHPDSADALQRLLQRELPDGWDSDLPSYAADAKGIAGRQASGKAINAIGPHVPWMVTGSADLNASTNTDFTFAGAGSFSAADRAGRILHYGIREHAMGSITNGLALSGLRPICSTFLIFSDYMKPPIRLAAIMELPAIFVFTHDSIGVGEDGPTHQPVEQLASLRAVPGLIVLRPADANEVTESWRVIMGLKHQPACLVLSRQPLPVFDRAELAPATGVARGAYVLAGDPHRAPDVILIGTGSEVQHCLAARAELAAEGIEARVVSMPSWELFEQQEQGYRDGVLPPGVNARVTIEQASVIGWDRYAGRKGARIGMQTFGSSAPLADLLKHFGFTPDRVAQAAREQVAAQRRQA